MRRRNLVAQHPMLASKDYRQVVALWSGLIHRQVCLGHVGIGFLQSAENM